MKILALILVMACGGCSISKFNQPPTYASAVTTHSRFFGLKADIPMGGTTVMGVHLGWGSVTWAVIPVSTNQLYTATVSDIFTLSSALNPFDTAIKEILQTGYGPSSVPTPPLRMFEQDWKPVPPPSQPNVELPK